MNKSRLDKNGQHGGKDRRKVQGGQILTHNRSKELMKTKPKFNLKEMNFRALESGMKPRPGPPPSPRKRLFRREAGYISR